MRVVGVHLVEVGDRVEAPGHVPDRLAGGNAEGAQHHGQRRGDLLAEADPVAEEELVDGVGARRQRRDVLRVVGVGADPVDERLHLVVGRGVVGGDRPGQGQHARVGVRQLHLLARDVRGERERAVVGPELRRGGGADLRIDRVDGPAAQTDGRDDGAVAGDVDLAGGEPQLARALRVEHEVRRRARDVEGLEVALPEGHVAERDRAGRTASSGASGCRGTGCDAVQLWPCHVSKVSPTQYEGRWALTCITSVLPRSPAQGRVEAGGEAEIAADADPAGRTAGTGQLRGHAGVAGEPSGDTDRAAGAGPGDERDPGRRRRAPGGRGRRRPPPSTSPPAPAPGPSPTCGPRRSPTSTFRSGPRGSSRPRPRRRGRSGGRSPARRPPPSGRPMRRA